jgi:arylsulfatase B
MALSLAALALALAASAAHALPATAPKYIFTVIVDDLGWGDVGFHRSVPIQDVQTPNLDALAAEGIELTRHMVHSMCTPSRSSFMSGRLPVHVQQTLANPEEFYAGMPANMTALAGKLKEAGYRTSVTGKVRERLGEGMVWGRGGVRVCCVGRAVMIR